MNSDTKKDALGIFVDSFGKNGSIREYFNSLISVDGFISQNELFGFQPNLPSKNDVIEQISADFGVLNAVDRKYLPCFQIIKYLNQFEGYSYNLTDEVKDKYLNNILDTSKLLKNETGKQFVERKKAIEQFKASGLDFKLFIADLKIIATDAKLLQAFCTFVPNYVETCDEKSKLLNALEKKGDDSALAKNTNTITLNSNNAQKLLDLVNLKISKINSSLPSGGQFVSELKTKSTTLLENLNKTKNLITSFIDNNAKLVAKENEKVHLTTNKPALGVATETLITNFNIIEAEIEACNRASETLSDDFKKIQSEIDSSILLQGNALDLPFGVEKHLKRINLSENFSTIEKFKGLSKIEQDLYLGLKDITKVYELDALKAKTSLVNIDEDRIKLFKDIESKVTDQNLKAAISAVIQKAEDVKKISADILEEKQALFEKLDGLFFDEIEFCKQHPDNKNLLGYATKLKAILYNYTKYYNQSDTLLKQASKIADDINGIIDEGQHFVSEFKAIEKKQNDTLSTETKKVKEEWVAAKDLVLKKPDCSEDIKNRINESSTKYKEYKTDIQNLNNTVEKLLDDEQYVKYSRARLAKEDFAESNKSVITSNDPLVKLKDAIYLSEKENNEIKNLESSYKESNPLSSYALYLSFIEKCEDNLPPIFLKRVWSIYGKNAGVEKYLDIFFNSDLLLGNFASKINNAESVDDFKTVIFSFSEHLLFYVNIVKPFCSVQEYEAISDLVKTVKVISAKNKPSDEEIKVCVESIKLAIKQSTEKVFNAQDQLYSLVKGYDTLENLVNNFRYDPIPFGNYNLKLALLSFKNQASTLKNQIQSVDLTLDVTKLFGKNAISAKLFSDISEFNYFFDRLSFIHKILNDKIKNKDRLNAYTNRISDVLTKRFGNCNAQYNKVMGKQFYNSIIREVTSIYNMALTDGFAKINVKKGKENNTNLNESTKIEDSSVALDNNKKESKASYKSASLVCALACVILITIAFFTTYFLFIAAAISLAFSAVLYAKSKDSPVANKDANSADVNDATLTLRQNINQDVGNSLGSFVNDDRDNSVDSVDSSVVHQPRIEPVTEPQRSSTAGSESPSQQQPRALDRQPATSSRSVNTSIGS